MADETEMTRGRAAYEAAAKVSGCDQPWAEANQPKWEAAAEAVRDTAIIECLQVAKDLADQAEGFNHTVQAASYRMVEIHLRGLRR